MFLGIQSISFSKLNIGEIDMISCQFPKAVHVRAYMRYTRGHWEKVCEHCRSYPNV